MNDEPDNVVPAIDRHAKLTVGVVVERRKAKSRWQNHVWQPVEVMMLVPSIDPWTVMYDADGITRFYAGAYTMELYQRETISYRENLVAERPGVYVVLRPDPAMPYGVRIELVTPSPADAEAYMASGEDLVDKVPMPEPVAEWLAAYVDTFHVEETFHKRRRDKPGGGRRNGGSATR